MTDPEIAEIFAFARSLWPHDVAPGSEGVQTAWSGSLRRLQDASMLGSVLMEMAERSEKFPSLAVLLEAYTDKAARRAKALAEAEAAAAFRLEPPEPSPIEKNLAAFDASARRDREARHRELALFVASHPGVEFDVAKRDAEIDEIGYCEQRARAMLERGVPPGEAGKELYYSLSEAIAGMKRLVLTT